ncbi:MAG TPA: AAA family ATPase, partial [Gemmatales bacterium]|nr:AAA family ATPase [Gemmatales bacterium]
TSSFNRRWLIKGLLVADQPGVIGGAKKMLKTSIMIAMAISMASGKAFLKKFDVPEKMRVAVFSGESGDSTIQETAKRICESMKVDLSTLDILWGFDLPQLGKSEELGHLGKLIREKEIKVIFIDPLYLCLLGGRTDVSPSNLFQMGPLLKEIAKVCLDAGATPLLVHHCTMGSGKKKSNPDLSDLSFAGIQEFVRQWVMIGRRNAFVPGSGRHDLCLQVGGSAGQSGEWPLTIREGRLAEDFTGRYWKTSFPTSEDLADERKSRSQNKAREELRKNCKKVIQVLKKHPDGETKSVIFRHAKLNSINGGEALERLERRREVERCDIEKKGRSHPAYRLVANNGNAAVDRHERKHDKKGGKG